MKKFNYEIVAATAFGLALNTATALAADDPRPGVRLVALDAGLALAADMIKSELAAEPIEDMPLGEIAGDLPGGVRMQVNDATLDATIADVALTAHQDLVRMNVGLEHVRIELPMMRVSMRIFGQPVSGTCHGAAIHWGNLGAVPLVADIGMDVAAKRLALQPVRMSHDVTSRDYGVDGPTHCDAPPGVDHAMRAATATALQGVRPMIEPTLRRRFEAMVPDFSDAATAALSPSFPFTIAGVPGLPSRTAEFSLFPMSVTLTDGRMALVAGTEVTVDPEEKLAREGAPQVTPVPLASVGINPGILTDAFASLFPDGTDFIEIDETTAPGLRDVLDIRSAASIWPDLQHIPLSKPYLRLWVRVASAPELSTDVATQSIRAAIPGLQMKFQIQQGGAWRDYFVMNVGVRTGVTATIAQETLSLNLASDSRVAVTGNWADGYTPTIDIFEQDVAAFLFSSVFDYLSAAGPLTSIWVPTMVVGDRDVTLGNVAVDELFLNLDVVDVTP